MSVSSEVQRTLVKSPPELWAELSDPGCLARHLGELGEIRITGTDPERLVDWEATGADGAAVSGRVEIEPSGWGTRVTLFASRDLVEQESEQAPGPGQVQPPELAPESEAMPASAAIETTPEVEPPESGAVEIAPTVEPAPAPEAEAESETEPEMVEPEPRPGFFARLFRRRKLQPAPESTLEPASKREPIASTEAEEPAPEPEPVTEPEPAPIAILEIDEPAIEEQPEDPTPDIAAELAELEEQTTAVLTSVLDRLGAAHHRPFSRA